MFFSLSEFFFNTCVPQCDKGVIFSTEIKRIDVSRDRDISMQEAIITQSDEVSSIGTHAEEKGETEEEEEENERDVSIHTGTYHLATQWDKVTLTGLEVTSIKSARKDIILYEDYYYPWNWKTPETPVDTSRNGPLIHSPGITYEALDYVVRGCPRPCEVLIVSTGWQDQLPIRDDAKLQFNLIHPTVKLEQLNSGQCADRFNDLMDKGISAALMLHTTC
jgi:hypothetical protein